MVATPAVIRVRLFSGCVVLIPPSVLLMSAAFSSSPHRAALFAIPATFFFEGCDQFIEFCSCVAAFFSCSCLLLFTAFFCACCVLLHAQRFATTPCTRKICMRTAGPPQPPPYALHVPLMSPTQVPIWPTIDPIIGTSRGHHGPCDRAYGNT